MRILLKWIVWTGIAFIIGGLTSLAMTLGVTGELHFLEDLSSYSIGWMMVGGALIEAGYFIKGKERLPS